MILYEVSGSFMLPGSRDTKDKLSFGPVKVLGKNRTEASAGLVDVLNDQFAKELRSMPRVAFQKNSFSKNFALMNLQWREVAIKPAASPKDIAFGQALQAVQALAAIPQEDRNDPPAIETV
jgi:hypothetical protein